jgi:hypothetical protein
MKKSNKILTEEVAVLKGGFGMIKLMSKIKRSRTTVMAGMVCSMLLFVLLSFQAAAAVEFTPLASINRGLTYPTDMAVSSSGAIYVVDGLSNKVLIYNAEYRYTGTVTSVEVPISVALYYDELTQVETLYIADNASKSVKIFDPASRQAIGFLKQDASGTMATFKLPRNIATGPDGTVYVVDQFNDSIEVFNSSGFYVKSITGVTLPQDVVATGEELFIIEQPQYSISSGSYIDPQNGSANGSDVLNASRIQIYNLAANGFVDVADHAFPTFGGATDNGEYISLRGIGVDSQGYIYVSDSFLQVIYKFSPAMTIDNGDGTSTDIIVGTFEGPINDGLSTPLGMTISEDGRLFVTSSYDGMVKVLGVDQIAGANTWMNEAPVAVAGSDQTVEEGATFVLDGSGSSDSNGSIQSYSWKQTGGIPALGENPFITDSSSIDVTAPDVGPEGATLTFQLVVTDAYSKASAVSTTEVTVNNVISGSVVINGGVMYTNDPLATLTMDAPEAVEMRLANDDEEFDLTYIPFASSGLWTLTDIDGERTVNVEFRDSGGNTTNASSSVILDTTPPAVPGIDAGGTAGEFNWAPVDGAASYTLQYASNIDFTGAVTLTGLDYNGLTLALDGLAVGTWFWHVQSVDDYGNASGWSDVGTFAVAPDCSGVPDAPQLALPFDNAGDIFRTAILETNAMIYPADCGTHLRTEWQVSQESGFNTLVMHVGTTLDNLTVYQIPALVLEPATKYYWRVRQVASNGKQSGWSEVWEFTTIAVPDEQGVDGVLYVQPEGDADTGSDEEISIREVVGDAGIQIMAIRVSSGVVVKTVKELDPDTIPDPVNKPASFPLGLLSFKLTVETGAIAQVEVSFSGEVPNDADWYIYNVDEGWHAYAGAIFSLNLGSVTLNFQDGGIGDADGVANGIIVNP